MFEFNIKVENKKLFETIVYIILRNDINIVLNINNDTDTIDDVYKFIDLLMEIRDNHSIKYLTGVSACLAGFNTKYNGGNNYNSIIRYLLDNGLLVVICPEVSGGLTTPRNPSEIVGDKVMSNVGLDVTDNFNKGAEFSLNKLEILEVDFAILKEGSPSCGVKRIYDGTFSGVKKDGMGITSRLFSNNNISFISEDVFLNYKEK